MKLKLVQNSGPDYFLSKCTSWHDNYTRLECTITFDEFCAKFPECVVPDDTKPRWGEGIYRRTEDNGIELEAEDWDTSG